VNLLVVDDDDDVRRYMKDLLLSAGHQVTAAASGVEALLQVELQRFDAVILDLMMPGIDGFQIAEFMSSHWNTFDTPVLIVSSRSDPESKSLARVYACRGFLSKPFGPAELLDAVAGLDQSHPARPNFG
jgi:DNA-binding response OmpR family regulator